MQAIDGHVTIPTAYHRTFGAILRKKFKEIDLLRVLFREICKFTSQKQRTD